MTRPIDRDLGAFGDAPGDTENDERIEDRGSRSFLDSPELSEHLQVPSWERLAISGEIIGAHLVGFWCPMDPPNLKI